MISAFKKNLLQFESTNEAALLLGWVITLTQPLLKLEKLDELDETAIADLKADSRFLCI